MATPLKIEVRKRETIKPSSPTPDDKKILKLSLLDQFTPILYTSLVLFYPGDFTADPHVQTHERSQRLKTSLSEVLTGFFPLAGRLKDNAYVECNDNGAEYTEARINCLLADSLKEPDTQVLKQLLPAPIESTEAATGHLLVVRVSIFDCGGMAIGVCISHKIADAATLATFIKSWAATAHKSDSTAMVSPVFMGASMFPPLNFSFSMSPVEMMQQQIVTTKRFVFDGLKLAALKAKVASASLLEPTRVEAVSGLLWRCAVAASRSNLGSPKPSVFSLSVNMRTRFDPPLPKNYAGNCVGFVAPKIVDSDELELKGLVGRIRKEIEEFGESYAKRLQGEGEVALQAICEYSKEFGNLAMGNDVDFHNCTSWCRYGLYDAADFGWGKPTWMSSASTTFRNVIVMMDTKDGDGIEAWLTLSVDDVSLFESNQELLEFAVVNPAVSC